MMEPSERPPEHTRAQPPAQRGDQSGGPPEHTSAQPPEQPERRPDEPPTDLPRHDGPALLGTILFVIVALLTVFTIGVGGLGVLLILFLAGSWPLAAPGILLYVVAICLPVGLTAWIRQRNGRPSADLRLPSPMALAIGAGAAIVIGQLLQLARLSPLTLVTFWLAAALPPLAAVALASERLHNATTWRRAIFGLVIGSLVSTTGTLLLGGAVAAAAYAVVIPLRNVVAFVMNSPGLERMFYSPSLAAGMVGVAVVAPFLEELMKPIAVMLIARRLRGPSEAFVVGMAAGAGFAIVENMLYESGGFGLWAAVATLRGIGGVLHPLNAGLVSMGWYGVLATREPGRWRHLFGFYGLAVAIHMVWNGGLTLIFGAAGEYFFAANTWEISVYGLAQPGIVLVFMVLEAIALWRLLILVTDRLRSARAGEPVRVESTLRLRLDDPRRMAAWAVGAMVVIVPIGLLYGPLVARYAERMIPIR